jgi:hypothetical protein
MKVRWLREPQPHDYPAATAYLNKTSFGQLDSPDHDPQR